MKKRFCLLLIFVILLFSGCSAPGMPYFKAEDIEKAERIVLAMCENENPQTIYHENGADPRPHLDLDKITEVKELDKSKISDFAKDFSEILFLPPSDSASINSPIGFAVLMYFDNGEILVISVTSYDREKNYCITARCDSEGVLVERLGNVSYKGVKIYKSLLIKYFNVC